MPDTDITSEKYWNQRYQEDNTPWDIGQASPPLIGYLQHRARKDAHILIPGAGNGYEAEWLWRNGYRHTHVIDIAPAPLEQLQQRLPDFPANQLIHGDFFHLEKQFDLIVEQTFFCALPPRWREKYAQKMAASLKPGGRLFGVLFHFPLAEDGPPFGGSEKEYRQLFARYFELKKMAPCYNSIASRMGKELFFIGTPRDNRKS